MQSISELYLCEKPSQGRDIAKILGASQRKEGYLQGNNKGKQLIVTWCIGHLLELQTPDAYDAKYKRWSLTDLPIIPSPWKMLAKKSTKKQLAVIKKLLKQAQHVVIATDADREGETIAREVLEQAKYKGTMSRLWLSALDSVSIKRALANIKASSETEPLYYSGLARGRADWLIGMNLTRYFTIQAKTSYRKGKKSQVRSVGRVQTPTLTLIAKRDREIINFKPQPYYEVYAFFLTQTQELLESKWIVPTNTTDKGLAEQNKLCLDKSIAQAVIERCQHQLGLVTTATTQRKKQTPPLLYHLSGLQQEGSRRWGYGAQEVLNIAQSLYETHKLTSYPRSDCEYLPMSQFADVSRVLSALCKNDQHLCDLVNQANIKQRSRVWNDKKVTAHHAIIPTQATPGLSRLSTQEFNIYNLIRRRYLAQFFPDAEYDQSTIIVDIKEDQFKANGRIARIAGWKKVINEPKSSSSNTGQIKANTSLANQYQAETKQLPSVKKGEQLPCNSLKLVDKKTLPPKYFTEGTLIKAMESIGSQVTDKVLKKVLRETAGLGTQATRANIIQTLFQRQFIKKDKKLIKTTPLGFELIDALPETIKDPILTAQWEQQLDDIANQSVQKSVQLVDDFLQQQIYLLNSILKGDERITLAKAYHPEIKKQPEIKKVEQNKRDKLSQAMGNCPECDQELEIRQATRGKKLGMDYIGCSRFPNCRYYRWP